MPYLVDKGYCRKCKRVTKHRFSLAIACLKCGVISTQEEFREEEVKNTKEKLSKIREK